MKFKSIFLPIFILITTVFALIHPDTSSALSVEKACTKVETVFVRGSGAPLSDERGEAIRFFDQIDSRLRNSSSVIQNRYELGTETYGGYKYPAVAVNDFGYATAIGAYISGGQSFAYGDSVKQGVGELQSYLSQRYAKCKSSGTLYILGGYSQGAQVVGQALSGISQEIRNSIVFTGFFGDPKLHYPEGEGWNPPACQGKSYSPWRRAASNCDLDSGSLGARKPYLPDDMKSKSGLWCYGKDTICDPGAFGEMSGHSEYKSPGRAIDEAAREAVGKLVSRLPSETGQSVDTSRSKGSGTSGIDTVFVIDTTGSMSGIIEQTKRFARNSADQIKAQNGRVALVGYKDAGDVYTAQIFSGFEDSYDTFLSQLNNLSVNGGGDTPEATLHALMTAMNGLSWKNGATKAAVVLTDATYHNPDVVDGTTVDTVAKRSLEIDPVNIYPVVDGGIIEYYQELATKTSGQVITNTGDTVAALTTALTKIQNRPVALLKNTEYKAAPNQEITFDASDSYVIDATITKYEWDFNGDGIFDETSVNPIVNHTYTANFTGNMQVRLTADNGTIANTSAVVTISTATAPTPPAAPKNLKSTITSTTNNKSTITISWDSNPNVEKWLIALNDVALGYVVGSQTTLQITDVDRTNDVSVTVAGAKSSLVSPSSSITIAKVTPPVLSTCSQSNIFLKLFCQAIALVKVVINGVVYFILPWAI